MSVKSFISVTAIAAFTGLGASIASAATIDINGGNSWTGWNSVGNSQTSGIWVFGSTTRTFNIYSSSFVLSASQTIGGTRLADGSAGNGTSYTGDTGSSLFTDGWQAGDRIVGIGIRYTGTSRGNTFFFHTDSGGNNIAAASSVGAGDGQFGFDVGDTSSYMITYQNDWTRGKVRQYSIFNGYSSNGGSNFIAPYGTMPSLQMPTRSFAVLDSGSVDAVKSVQFFINVDAVLRSNGGLGYGEGNFLAPSTRFAFLEMGADGYTEQVFAIPAQGSVALLSLGGVLVARRRR
jgi:hypothetical protein